LHTDFQSQQAIEQQLIKQTLTKAVYMTGPIMSSQESYASKRNDLLSYIEDQAAEGVYKTWSHEVKTKDDLSGVEKTVTVVTVVEKDGKLTRQEISPLKKYSVQINGLALNSIDYDKTVEAQINAQQQATMQVQTAMANSKKAEQDAITTELQGKASAAKAKWEQEVIKAKNVTAAESELAVQDLATKQAALYKQQQILEGEGDAQKQRLMMAANGNLDQKLEAYKTVQKYWADAFGKYQGAIVPSIQTGGGNTGNGALNFAELMSMKAAKDLSLDMKNK
jgi:regulator of protease activity HflC (stomatin/prohibitin superfamily)